MHIVHFEINIQACSWAVVGLFFFFVPGYYCVLFGTMNCAAVLFFALQIVMLGFGLHCLWARNEHVENPWLHAGIAEKSISLANLWA